MLPREQWLYLGLSRCGSCWLYRWDGVIVDSCIEVEPRVRELFIYGCGDFGRCGDQPAPHRWLFFGTQVWDGCKIVVEYDMELGFTSPTFRFKTRETDPAWHGECPR